MSDCILRRKHMFVLQRYTYAKEESYVMFLPKAWNLSMIESEEQRGALGTGRMTPQ